MSADSGLEKRLLILMGARLALSLVSLGVAFSLEAAGWIYSPAEWRGFYGTVIFALVATIGYGLILRRVRRVKRFVVLNIATDIAIVSALVHLSGGADRANGLRFISASPAWVSRCRVRGQRPGGEHGERQE